MSDILTKTLYLVTVLGPGGFTTTFDSLGLARAHASHWQRVKGYGMVELEVL